MLRSTLAVLILLGVAVPASSEPLCDPPQSEPDRWLELAPPVRAGHVAVVDVRDQRLILFGGSVGGHFTNDLWAMSLWGRHRWERLDAFGEGPSPRVGAAAAYDPVRRRLILHGGLDSRGAVLGDLWELSLDRRMRWRRLDATGDAPAARWRHTLTLTREGGAVLFGGSDDTWARRKLPDAWRLALDSLHWSRLAPGGTAPGGRSGHSAVFSPDLDGLIVFGGETGAFGPVSSETWLLRMGAQVAWERVAPDSGGPCAMHGHVAAWDARGHRMLVFASQAWRFWECAARGGVWALTVPDLRWSVVAPVDAGPGTIAFAAAAYDPVTNSVVIHGGADTPGYPAPDEDAKFSDVWRFTLGAQPAWRRITPETPPWEVPGPGVPIRISYDFGNQTAFDARRNRVLVVAEDGTAVWSYDIGRARWQPIEVPGARPTPIGGDGDVAAVLDTRRDRLIVMGWVDRPDGRVSVGGEVWSLRLGERPEWSVVPARGARPVLREPSALYDPIRDQALVCNGFRTGVLPMYQSGVWALRFDDRDSSSWRQVSSEADSGRQKAPRYNARSAIALDTRRDRLLVFGGGDSGLNTGNGCYALDLGGTPAWDTLWAERPLWDSLPRPRRMAAAVYDAGQDRFLVLGGVRGGIFAHTPDDAWAFSLQDRAWTEIQARNRPGWTVPAVVHDRRRDRLLVFEHNAVWALEMERGPRRRMPYRHDDEIAEVMTTQLALLGAIPNPSHADLTLHFTLPDAAPASLELFDVVGRRVWRHDVGVLGAGRHSVRVAAEPVRAPGIYLVRLTHGRQVLTGKLVRISR